VSLGALAIPLYGFMRGGWLAAVLSGIALGMSARSISARQAAVWC
jgi:hypothetical protein